jgi:hypothetical protein
MRLLPRRRRPVVALGAPAVLGVLAALVAIVAVLTVLGLRHSHLAACRSWQELLDRRTAENEALLGAETARQFRREALAFGRIDVAGRTVQRPSNC